MKNLTLLLALFTPLLAHAYPDPFATPSPAPAPSAVPAASLAKPFYLTKQPIPALTPASAPAAATPAAPTAPVKVATPAPAPTPAPTVAASAIPPAKSMIPAKPIPPAAAPAPVAASAPETLPAPVTTTAPAKSASPFTIDRLGELQSKIAILKAENALAKARLELATSGGGTPDTSAQPASAQSWTTAASPLPTVKGIAGPPQHLTATLALPDGTRLPVTEGAHVGSYTVSHIGAADVTLINKRNQSVTLGF